jgi:pimeloyl-ACP methyl ester carboxylesterase
MDLSATTLPTLALFGSKDGVLPPEEARQRARLLPKGAEVRFLEGFNHSSYGAYGPQPGDQAATVGKLAGWRIVSREVVAFLEKHLQP